MSAPKVHEFKIPNKTLEEVKELQELFSQQPSALNLENYDVHFVAKEKWNKTTKKYEKKSDSDTYRIEFREKGTNNAPASIPLGYFRMGRGSLVRASGHYLGGMTPADLEIKFNQNTQKGQNTTSAESAKHIVRLEALPGDEIQWLEDLQEKFIDQILRDIELNKAGHEVPIKISKGVQGLYTDRDEILNNEKFYRAIYADKDGNKSFRIKKHSNHKTWNDQQANLSKTFKAAKQQGMDDWETNSTSWMNQIKKQGRIPWPLKINAAYMDGEKEAEDFVRLSTTGNGDCNQDQLDYNDKVLGELGSNGSAIVFVEIPNTRKSHIEARVDIAGTYISMPGADTAYTIIGKFPVMDDLMPSCSVVAEMRKLKRAKDMAEAGPEEPPAKKRKENKSLSESVVEDTDEEELEDISE